MASRTVSDEKQAATHSTAMAIISAEKRKRDEKTARLRAARETAEGFNVADGTPKSAGYQSTKNPDDGA